MRKDIIAVKPIQDYQIHLTFENQREGIVNLVEIIEFTGIFASLKNIEYCMRTILVVELQATSPCACGI
jgi:hypothetical protein